MAQILPYERAVGQPGLGYQAQASGADPIGQALVGIGGSVANVGDALHARDMQVQNAQSTLALATLNNDLRDKHDELAQGLTSGTIDPSKAMEMFGTSATMVTGAKSRPK